MAEVIKTIKPSTGHYASFTAWEAGEQRALASGEVAVAEFYTFLGGLSDGGLISGWSFADITSRIKLTVASGHRHDGTPGSGFYMLNNGLEDCLRSGTVNLDVEWLELNGNGNAKHLLQVAAGAASANVTINNMLLHNTTSAGYGLNFAATNNIIANNVVCWNVGRAAYATAAGSTTVFLNNWTVYGCTGSFGILRAIVKNCYVGNSGTCFSGCSAGSDYNVSSDATAPGTNKATGKTAYTDYFVDPANGDFHLKNTSLALFGLSGADLSGTFTTDIDGLTRTAPWDIGADQYVAVGGGTTYQVNFNLSSTSIFALSNIANLNNSLNLSTTSTFSESAIKQTSSSLELQAASGFNSTSVSNLVLSLLLNASAEMSDEYVSNVGNAILGVVAGMQPSATKTSFVNLLLNSTSIFSNSSIKETSASLNLDTTSNFDSSAYKLILASLQLDSISGFSNSVQTIVDAIVSIAGTVDFSDSVNSNVSVNLAIQAVADFANYNNIDGSVILSEIRMKGYLNKQIYTTASLNKTINVIAVINKVINLISKPQ